MTYVIRGPSCLIVSGDMGDMIFERSGGVSLNFARNGFRYVAEKLACLALSTWAYSVVVTFWFFVATTQSAHVFWTQMARW